MIICVVLPVGGAVALILPCFNPAICVCTFTKFCYGWLWYMTSNQGINYNLTKLFLKHLNSFNCHAFLYCVFCYVYHSLELHSLSTMHLLLNHCWIYFSHYNTLPWLFRVCNLYFLPSTNGNSSSWSSLGLEGEAYEEHISFSPTDRLVRTLFVL